MIWWTSLLAPRAVVPDRYDAKGSAALSILALLRRHEPAVNRHRQARYVRRVIRGPVAPNYAQDTYGSDILSNTCHSQTLFEDRESCTWSLTGYLNL
jgi:hypothetical protein